MWAKQPLRSLGRFIVLGALAFFAYTLLQIGA